MASSRPVLIFELGGDGTPIAEHAFDPSSYSQKLIWIRIESHSPKNIFKKLNINLPSIAIETLLAEETRPRLFAYDGGLIANFRGINLNPGSAVEDMIAVRLWIKDNLIISVQRRRLASTEEMVHAIEQKAGPANKGDFLMLLLEHLTDRITDAVCSIDDEIDILEDTLKEKTSIDSRGTLSHMRRRIIMLRRYLMPQREAIARLQSDKLPWLDDVQSAHLRETADSLVRVLEDLDAARDRTTVLQDEITMRAQERTNGRIYLLSLVAMIFMPLGFLTGLLGTNVDGIPGAHSPHAFLVLCLLLFVIALLEYLFLYKKKWV